MENKRKIIIDCDPGHDDALAILWALASPELEILAVTTVAGNNSIDAVTNNAIKTLTKARVLNIPVARGYTDPMLGSISVSGGQVHGKSGMEGPILPENGFETSEVNAVQLITDILDKSDEKITIVALGPLTNIARVIAARPDIIDKINCISLMGGGTIGNWTPAAEYNIWADPVAAKIVYNSGIHIIMAGLDCTHKAYVTMEENEDLRAQGNEMSIFAAELIDYFIRYHLEVEGFGGCTLHDPCAVAVLLHPEMFEMELCNVDVETSGDLTKGMTVIDRINYREKIFGEKIEKNVSVLFGVDREAFRDKLFNAMKRLG